MKQRIFTFLVLFFTLSYLNAQILITEIMYNPPGTDDAEFLELYNNGDAAVNMEGYYFSEGIQYEFPAMTFNSGEYMLLAKDAVRFDSLFSMSATEWTGGGLKNSGEDIVLVTPDSTVVALVDYSDSGDWPSAADGNGPSLILCDYSGDNNDPANWKTATEGTGNFNETTEILASPGAASSCEEIVVDYPPYPIGLVTTNNVEGVPDSVNVLCQIQGVVYGVNMNSNGLQFTIIDENNDGIGLYYGGDLGYEVTEGDEVAIQGKISQYKGLTQISPDSIWVVSSGNALFEPTIVTELNEDTESQLIKFENVSLVDPGDWGDEGSSFNVTITDGTNSFTMRIDSDTDIDGSPAPVGVFTVTGIGGQYDGSSPYTDGYQIFPRYLTDIDANFEEEDDYPEYSIGEVTAVDENGVADSIDVKCQIQGIVYGVNFKPGGLQFALIDANNDGIGLYSSDDFGYTVNEGDEVVVQGKIGQYKGLTQIYPDSVWMVSSGNALNDPTVVTGLDESTESQLIKIEDVWIVDPADWTSAGSGFNVDVTNGTETYAMRIDADCNLFDTAPPSEHFNLTGIGGQYDGSEPYTEGYQILPRYVSDIDIIGGIIENAGNDIINVYPNPANDKLYIESEIVFTEIFIYNILGEEVSHQKNIDGVIDVNHLISGVYSIVFNSDNQAYSTKFIKK